MSFCLSFQKTIKIDHTCKYIEDKNFIYLYEGWINEYLIDDIIKDNFYELKKCNGEFYAVRINKITNSVEVMNDRLGSFMLFYSSTEKKISTNIREFEKHINNEWFEHIINKNTIKNFVHTNLDYNSFTRPHTSSDNEYALKNVRYIPVGTILSSNGDAFVLQNYFDTYNDFFNLEKKHEDEEEFTNFVQKRIHDNLMRITQQYRTVPVLCGGTGLDSMTILSTLLDQKKNFHILNYFFQESAESKNCHDNFTKLSNFLAEFHIKSISQMYSTNLFLNYLEKNFNLINHYNNNADILYDVIAVNENTEKNSLILKGTWGDECFWHLEHPYMLYLKSQGKTYKEAKELIKKTYAYMGENNPIRFLEKEWNSCNNGWLKDSAAYFFYKRPRYITSERAYSPTKHFFSPFADTELTNLPLKCKNKKLGLLCMDGTIQKKLLRHDLIKFLNKRKDGEQEIKNQKWKVDKNINFKKFMNSRFLKILMRTDKLSKLDFGENIDFESMLLIVYMILHHNLSDKQNIN